MPPPVVMGAGEAEPMDPEFMEPDFVEPDFIEPDFIMSEFIDPEFIMEPDFIIPVLAWRACIAIADDLQTYVPALVLP